MEKLDKNAKELHHEHMAWLSDLAEMRIELITLSKYNHGFFKSDIGHLFKRINSLEKTIKKHEKTLALAFKTCGIDENTEFFADHGNIRKCIVSTRFKLNNLNILFKNKLIPRH